VSTPFPGRLCNAKAGHDSKGRFPDLLPSVFQKGVLLRPLGDVIYFNPPLIINKKDMDFVVKVAKECTIETLKESFL